MNNGAFGENFPYSNFHDLNMDWIVKIAKDFLDQYTHIQEVIAQGLTDLQEKYETLDALLEAWYETHSADIANQLADALADLNEWYNTHQNYLDQELADNVAEFNRLADAKAEQTIASIPEDYTTLSNAVSHINNNTIKPLLIMANTGEDQYFSIEAVRSDLPGVYYVYTITSINRTNFAGISSWEVGSDYNHYTFTYERGSHNVGTSAIAYKYDNVITSEAITGYAALVADRSDYTLKIVSTMALTADQRVLAMFFGNGDALQRSITAYGNNHRMFTTRNNPFNKFYLVNGVNYKNLLTVSYNSTTRIYTVTRNATTGFIYGFTEMDNTQIAVGAEGVAGMTYPFPASFSSESAISGMAVIVATRSDQTSSTWKVIDFTTLQNNKSMYIVLGVVYRSSTSSILFFSKQAQQLFTNYGDYAEVHPVNRFYLINGQDSEGALSLNYDPETYIYTITRNSDSFFCYGLTDDASSGQISVGAEGVAGMTYPFPASFTSSPMRTGFAYIVATKNDTSTSTWKIITNAEYVSNYVNYILLGIVYHNNINSFFFSELARNMFTNYNINEIVFDSDLYRAFRKVGVIGDSLSVGYIWNKTAQTNIPRALEYSWPKQVMKSAGVPWLNFGTSGQGTLTWYSNSTYGKVQTLPNGNKCQAYIIGLGQNDQNPNASGYAPLGSPEDVTTDPDATVTTYYGGYSRIIAHLKRINPTCKIFCLTNPRVSTTSAPYNEAVRYIADTYYSNDNNVILVDLATDYSIYFMGNSYLVRDAIAIEGGHYSPSGYSRIATIMMRAISEAMERNASSMYNIAQIPYDTADPTPNTMTE